MGQHPKPHKKLKKLILLLKLIKKLKHHG
jgi:hypothetical protein